VDAIQHLVNECREREDAIHRQLDAWAIEPLTIVYEDFVKSFETTIQAVLEYLRIPNAHAIRISAPAFEALADEVNDAWYERFLVDRPGERDEETAAPRARTRTLPSGTA